MYEVVEFAGQRVLTTVQVAEAYGVDAKSLQRNFQRNKERFQEGVHFILLTGDALRAYKAERQDESIKRAPSIYLWTEQGAFMLAKSLGSDKSWQAHESLVSGYYLATTGVQHSQPVQLLEFDQARFLELEQRVQVVEEMLQAATLYSHEQARLQQAISQRVYSLTFKQRERNHLFRALYSDLKQRYSVLSYRDIRRCDLDDVLEFVQIWNFDLATN